jgi:hypothetical protein
LTCNSNQKLINGQCIDLPSNCLDINVYYQCTQCASNYQIVAGVCTQCTGSNPNFPCLTCPTGAFINSYGTCQLINSYCAAYNSANGQCTSCSNGQAPVNGNCCQSDYTYQNGQCTQTSSNSGSTSSGSSSSSSSSKYGPYCQTINPTLHICLACLNGHYFDAAGSCSS